MFLRNRSIVSFAFFALLTGAILAPMPQATAQTRDRAYLYDAYIRGAATLYSLPPDFIRAVIRVESNFDPRCRSRVGASGLMQLMPETARSMGVRDVFDPEQNIYGGARFLRAMANRYDGDYRLILAAYNAGYGRVDRFLRRIEPLPEVTRTRYVPRVLSWYRRYLAD